MNSKIHIGKIIHSKLKEHNRSVSWLAKSIDYDPSNLCKILKQNYISTDMLLRISNALNCDFFMYYSDYLNEDKQ